MKTMKKYLFILAALAFAALAAPSAANAACGAGAGTCFVVAAGGNSNSTSTWSASSGGTTCTCVPAATDNVILDSLAGQLTINAALSVANFDASGTGGSGSPYTNTVSYSTGATLTSSGTIFKLVAGMTFTAASSSRIVSFNPTSGTLAVTTAGKILGSVVVNGTAGTTVQLQDDLNFVSGGTFTVTQATFDANNHNITGGAILSTNSNTRTITLGSGTITLNLTTGTVWDTTTTTGLTMTANTATIVVSSAATGGRSFTTGGLNFNGATLSLVNSGTVPAAVAITGAGTVGSLQMTAPIRVTFGGATTFTVTNAFTLAGTGFNNALSISTNDSNGGAATISVASGTPSLAWAAIQGMTFTGGATFTATNSFDLKGNTGITITGPSGGGARGVIGGWLLDRDIHPEHNDNTPAFVNQAA